MAQNREKSITLQVFAKLGNEKLLHRYCDILHKLPGLDVIAFTPPKIKIYTAIYSAKMGDFSKQS